MIIDAGQTYHSDLGLVATIGFFDGVHIGHQALIRQVRQEAKKEGHLSAVITFKEHPRTVLNVNEGIELLTCFDEKISFIEETGIDLIVVMDFDRQLSQLTAKEYIALLAERYSVKKLVVGYDHRFGRNRLDGFDQYVVYGRELGVEVIQAACYSPNELHISSSQIRRRLRQGGIAQARELLGHPYTIVGKVVHGRQLGRKIGFPTANIDPSCPHQLIPIDGVYAVLVEIHGQTYRGMMNVGTRPTVGDQMHRTLEVHLFDFSDDLYGKNVRVLLMDYIRPEIKFDTIELLTAQLIKDQRQIVRLLTD